MRITDHLLDPTDAAFVTGTEEDRAAARREWHRRRYAAAVANSGLPEIDRAQLVACPFGLLENTEDGRLLRPRRDDLVDPAYVPNAVGYFIENGVAVVVEPPSSGPQTVAEREQQRANRERRRATPRAKPAWMR